MIIGTFVTNIRNNQIIARMQNPINSEKIEYFLLDFINSVSGKTGVLIKDLYKYIYSFSEDNYYVLITSILYNEIKANKVLNYIIKNSSTDPMDILVTIDNILYSDSVLFPNLTLIKSLESQDEKIYNIMMKNKEMEIKRKQKALKYKSTLKNEENFASVATSKLEEIHNKQLELTKQNLEDLKIVNKVLKATVKEKKKRFESSESPIFICIKERLKCEVDIENNLKNAEIAGEMTVNIKEEAYKNLEVQLSGDYNACKFSPKLDKQGLIKGCIRSDKDFPLNKNIALMKYKKTNIEKIPIQFTFWPSEIKLNTYQISLEYSVDEDLNDLVLMIPKDNMKDIVVEGVNETNNFIEWNIGSISSGDSDSLDFQCKCNDPNEIFPIDVYFTGSKTYFDIGVSSVRSKGKDVEDNEIKKILEVDSFSIKAE